MSVLKYNKMIIQYSTRVFKMHFVTFLMDYLLLHTATVILKNLTLISDTEEYLVSLHIFLNFLNQLTFIEELYIEI